MYRSKDNLKAATSHSMGDNSRKMECWSSQKELYAVPQIKVSPRQLSCLGIFSSPYTYIVLEELVYQISFRDFLHLLSCFLPNNTGPFFSFS